MRLGPTDEVGYGMRDAGYEIRDAGCAWRATGGTGEMGEWTTVRGPKFDVSGIAYLVSRVAPVSLVPPVALESTIDHLYRLAGECDVGVRRLIPEALVGDYSKIFGGD